MFNVKLPPDIALLVAKFKLPPTFIVAVDSAPFIVTTFAVNAPLISTSPFNEASPDILVVPLTSNVRVGDIPIPTLPSPFILINSVPPA